jgi:hypothetical protein
MIRRISNIVFYVLLLVSAVVLWREGNRTAAVMTVLFVSVSAVADGQQRQIRRLMRHSESSAKLCKQALELCAKSTRLASKRQPFTQPFTHSLS